MEKNPFEVEFNKKATFNLDRVTPAVVRPIAADKSRPNDFLEFNANLKIPGTSKLHRLTMRFWSN